MVEINEALIIGLAVAGWIVYRVIRLRTGGRTNVVREGLVNLFFVYLLGVFHVTFFPMIIILYAFDPYDANLTPFVETLRFLRYTDQPGVLLNLVGNLVLLAPLGIFLPALFKWARQVFKVLFIGFLVSLTIEIFQLALAVRVFDIDDVIINTLGVLLGFSIFAAANRIPFLAQRLAIYAQPDRRGQTTGFIMYSLFVVAVFLSIYSIQITQQTKTVKTIVDNLAVEHRQLLGVPGFGEFLLVFSESNQGEQAVDIYRRVFFDRYTDFESHPDLHHLNEGLYTVSGMSTGHTMNYFVIARSEKPVAAMTSSGRRYPVASVGEYHVAYARAPIDQNLYFSFRFIDSKGADLNLQMEQ